MYQGRKVEYYFGGLDILEAVWVWLELVSDTKQVLTPEVEEALWVKYKELPIWGVEYSPRDMGKMQETSSMGS
jgi:hypothetical protein